MKQKEDQENRGKETRKTGREPGKQKTLEKPCQIRVQNELASAFYKVQQWGGSPQQLLDREAFTRAAFTHRSFYTKTLLHRNLHTEKLLHRGACTQSSFTHRRFYAELLHTEAFSNRSLHTQGSQELYREQLFLIENLRTRLHKAAFTQKSFYTQMPLHTAALRERSLHQSSVYTQRSAIHLRRHFSDHLRRHDAHTLLQITCDERSCEALQIACELRAWRYIDERNANLTMLTVTF